MRIFLLILICSGMTIGSWAQQNNDTVYSVRLKNVDVKEARKWANDTARYHFNQLKRNVNEVMPYVITATRLFEELDAAKHQPGMSKKEWKKYVTTKEDQIRTEFEDKVSQLNTTQGVLLVKLIARQSEMNIYEMVGEMKNGFTAVKWQTWAKLNGFNLNKKYDPVLEPLLEKVMDNLGYPLPDGYVSR